jgi:hypothetical protein
MSRAAARIAEAPRPDPIAVFTARAAARAMLWTAGELTLHTAVDELWAAAVRDGLVAKLGADEVQRLLADAFAPERDDLDPDDVSPERDDPDDLVPDPIPEDPPSRPGAAASTLMAAEFLIREGDAERFRHWLDRHSAEEREAILQYLVGKKENGSPI